MIAMLIAILIICVATLLHRWRARRRWYTRAKWAPLDASYNFHPPGSRLSLVDRLFFEAPRLDAFELEEGPAWGVVVVRVRRGVIGPDQIEAVRLYVPCWVELQVLP